MCIYINLIWHILISERKMISTMIILNTNMNISMETAASNTQIKKTFLEVYEKDLKERYNPPTILPIPDGAPTDVPLVIMQSLSNHTQLILTKSSISIGTGYDDNFNTDWNKCEKHLLEKVKDVFLIIEAIESIKINYIGLIAQIIEDENTDASEYIFDNLLKFTSNKSVYDTECRLTYVLKDEYYINLDLQNIRLFDGKPVMTGSETTSINKKANIENKLAITIDINNRYSHNFNKENREIGKESVDQIVLYTNNIVNNLGSIVKGDVEIED